MIEYLVTAFFVAQPAPPAMAASAGVGRARGEVEITSKRVSFSRDLATFKEDVAVRHQTMDLRCDELTAHYASYNGKYTATRGECLGNVRVVDGERTARGERAEFDVPTGMLVVTGNPEARDPTAHLQGSEVRLTLGNQNFEVKDATVTFQAAPLAVKTSQPSHPVVIHARRVSGTRGQAVFTGDVVVKHRTMDLRCDKLTTYLNGPREVSRADCVGNVRAVDGDRRAKGERARFDVPTGVLVVTGNPEAEDPMISFRGAEVRMTLGGKSFEGDDATVIFKTAPLKEQQRKRKGTPGGAAGDTDQPGGAKQP